MPNFVLLDTATGEDWWADVLANSKCDWRAAFVAMS
jgi:hypothetical protein